MNKLNKFIYFLGLSMIILIGCSDADDEITDIDYDRLFSPTEVTAKIVKKTSIELTWNAVNKADSYNIEVFANGDLSFEGTPALVLTGITKRPYTIENLQRDTDYSVRIQAVSASFPSSKWVGIVGGKTDPEQIFKPVEKEDITKTKVTLRWTEGETATEIVLEPGDIRHAVTASEITAGAATISGLTHGTKYKATILNGAKVRGIIEFETKAEGTTVRPNDDLIALIANADDGDVFLLEPGDYLTDGKKVVVSKSITIQGTTSKPKVHAQFEVENALVKFRNLELDGNGTLDHVVRLASTSGSYDGIVFDNCDVKNYVKSIVAGESSAIVIVKEININNSIFTNILAGSSEAIDIRSGHVETIEITNSTFNNVATNRSLIRLDEKSSTFPGRTSTVLIQNNTFYKVSNSDSYQGFFYVRFKNNTITFKNNLVANTAGFLNKSNSTTQPECGGNNYFGAPNFLPGSTVTGGVKFDNGIHTTKDPQFSNAAEGNFKVNNIDVDAGDPRWLN